MQEEIAERQRQLDQFLTDEGRAAVDRLFSQCRAEKQLCEIRDGEHDVLVCDIQQDAHAGLNHHDPVYGVWWSACDLPEHGHKEPAA